MLSASVDLGHVGAQARDNEPGRLQDSSKIMNSVVTTGSNTIGGLGGLQPPLQLVHNGNMGRVREKKRWRKEEKWREREKNKRPGPLSPP
jgi:hypothetical protein